MDKGKCPGCNCDPCSCDNDCKCGSGCCGGDCKCDSGGCGCSSGDPKSHGGCGCLKGGCFLSHFKHPKVFCLVKIVLVLLILGAVSMCSFACGVKFGRFGHGMMGGSSPVAPTSQTAVFDKIGLDKHMKFFGEDEGKGITKLFGTITKIEGDKITILDNSAKEAVVTSESGTTIMNSTSEIGLSALKVGQNITSYSKTDKDDKSVAVKLIQVMP